MTLPSLKENITFPLNFCIENLNLITGLIPASRMCLDVSVITEFNGVEVSATKNVFEIFNNRPPGITLKEEKVTEHQIAIIPLAFKNGKPSLFNNLGVTQKNITWSERVKRT